MGYRGIKCDEIMGTEYSVANVCCPAGHQAIKGNEAVDAQWTVLVLCMELRTIFAHGTTHRHSATPEIEGDQLPTISTRRLHSSAGPSLIGR